MFDKKLTNAITPDSQAVDAVEQLHSEASEAERYRLAQADTLIRSVGIMQGNGTFIPSYVRVPDGDYIKNPDLSIVYRPGFNPPSGITAAEVHRELESIFRSGEGLNPGNALIK